MRRAKKKLTLSGYVSDSHKSNPTAFKVMALPLSSSSIILSSKKLSFNVSISRKSTQKHLLLSAHFAFRPNEARSQVTARSAVRACNSTPSTYAKDLTCEHNFPPNCTFEWLGLLVCFSSKSSALFSGHQGPKNWGACIKKGHPSKHKHEVHTDFS
ncbi:hypothetical protein OIU78_017779 [Salix suchowensis]|nr:hypothetical protein OIU78_017779 [Salix suchowensis]